MDILSLKFSKKVADTYVIFSVSLLSFLFIQRAFYYLESLLSLVRIKKSENNSLYKSYQLMNLFFPTIKIYLVSNHELLARKWIFS